MCAACLVAQLSLTLCESMDFGLPGPSIPGDSPGKNTGVGCHALLQGIFPTQGLNMCIERVSCIGRHSLPPGKPISGLYHSLLINSPTERLDFPGGSNSKESACNLGDLSSIPGLAAHSSILAWRIPRDRGPWWATFHGVTKSQTRLSD